MKNIVKLLIFPSIFYGLIFLFLDFELNKFECLICCSFSGYTLKYHVKDVLETTVIRNLSAEATQVKVTDLRPTTAYTFEIFAWTVVGPGPVETATIQSGIPPGKHCIFKS